MSGAPTAALGPTGWLHHPDGHGLHPRAEPAGLETNPYDAEKDPAVVERMKEFSATTIGSTPGELGKHVTAELAKWKPVVEGANIQMD